MPNYKNNSLSVKTFYGVEFKPGEVHSVPGYINAKGMNRVSDTFFQKQSKDVSKDKLKIESIDLAPKPDIPTLCNTPEEVKSKRGRKSKKIIESTIEETSEEPILSENIIEEGEEINGANSD